MSGTGGSDSKRDLVSVSSGEDGRASAGGMAATSTSLAAVSTVRRLQGGLVAASVLALGLAIALIVVCEKGKEGGEAVAVWRSGSSEAERAIGVLEDTICLTKGCIEASNRILNNMDRTVDPCDNFYEFACGGFHERIVIPDSKSSRSQFSLISEKLIQQIREILEEGEEEEEEEAKEEGKVAKNRDGDSRVFSMARNVYKACMNTDRIEELGLQPLKDMLKLLGGWPVLEADNWKEESFDWKETVYKFRRQGYSSDYIIDFSIVTDSKNSTWRVIDIDQASLGMSREYLINGMEDKDVASYYQYMVDVAVLLGADRQTAEAELKDSLQFEMDLAHASQARENRRNSTRMYNPMKVKELSSLAPDIPWVTYINNILTEDLFQIDGDERVIVDEPGYLRNLTVLLPKTSKRAIANYMLWRAAASSLGYFTEAARKVQLDFAKRISGKKSETERWKRCSGSATGSFSSPVGSMYVRKHFNEDAKQAMVDMVKDIRGEFNNILQQVDWMDDLTRKRAMTKLKSMKEHIGYPEEILMEEKLEELYQDLHLSHDEYFLNSQNLSIWGVNYAWGKLREKVDKDDWKRHGAPAVVNAFYSPLENSIAFPAGILQENFFESDRPAYVNYGGIGWVIGHEITHGFDDRGKDFDFEGNLSNWWEEETKKRFEEKANCIIWQYGNYTAAAVNKSLNGVNTQGENIADNGGIKEAYRAYRGWVGRNGQEKRLPGLQRYNPYQMFWISAANTWCSKYRNKALEKTIKTGVHSPGMFRVLGTFSNSREFARDFKCPAGSNMNPRTKCEVW